MAFEITSSSFPNGGRIPKRYTGEGEDVSPAIAWDGVPPGTKTIALVCDDPDAPREEPFVHWVLYDVPNGHRSIREGESGMGVEGANDFGNIGYGGPMPPPGHGVHHYRFRVYALDRALGLASGATKQQLLDAIEGHVIAEGELVGTYERPAHARAG